uniref:Abhydrolase domain-containing protein 6 n=1 Tax=Dicentrarchus labrax TaxID=13489 RepID=E6ZGE8_DICLA|nr:Abhydrolase domain-containing protein 6 [Dicentrarchus labrax]
MELIMISGGILVVPVLAFITSFLFWPGTLLKAYNWYWRRRLGLEVHYSHSGSYRFCYSSRGTPGGATPSLLLLHGFSATKDMWLPVVKYLPRNQHVVCVDMPGHEGTSRTGAEDYCIQGQVARIHQVLRGLLANRMPNNGFYKEVFMEIVGEKSRHSLQENLHLITSPVQVIWGKEDQVVDVSGAAVLKTSLPSCQVEVLDDCGHSVALERPRKAANLIMDFLSALEVNGENAKKLS